MIYNVVGRTLNLTQSVKSGLANCSVTVLVDLIISLRVSQSEALFYGN